jgi:S-adenosylmethionine synthetase
VKDQEGKKLTDSEISQKVSRIFDMRPYAIVQRFGLKNPIFERTASYGHFGRDFYTEKVEVYYKNRDTSVEKLNGHDHYFKQVEFFAWEKLDYVDKIKKEFGL